MICCHNNNDMIIISRCFFHLFSLPITNFCRFPQVLDLVQDSAADWDRVAFRKSGNFMAQNFLNHTAGARLAVSLCFQSLCSAKLACFWLKLRIFNWQTYCIWIFSLNSLLKSKFKYFPQCQIIAPMHRHTVRWLLIFQLSLRKKPKKII